jgi:hypothetical protein
MDWVKKHYDFAILGLAALLLAANAAYLALQSGAAFETLSLPTVPPRSNEFQPPDTEAISKALEAAAAPARWTPDLTAKTQGSLFVSRTYLLGKADDGTSKLVDPFEGGENLHPPITNDWLNEHGLDFSDSGIKEKDNDGDGFSNLEEFNASTNPVDKTSAPPSFTKHQLLALKPIPFRLIFKGDGGTDGGEFQINLKDLKGTARTQYKKKGEAITGAPYKILDYKKNPGPYGVNATGDKSELVIENTETGDTLTLVYNTELDDPTSFGEFRNQLSGETFTLKKGEEFTIPPDPAKFKLIDITREFARIQDLATGQTSKVLMLETQAP